MRKSAAKTTPTVAVLGAGKLGAAVAALVARAGTDVSLWARRTDAAEQVIAALGHDGARVSVAASVEDACRAAGLVVFAVPTHALAEVARRAGDVARGDQLALHACRGAEDGFGLPHAVIRRETCIKKIGALGGPLYLDDAAHDRPLVAVLASRFDEVPRAVRALVAGTRVRIHATPDIVGVEVAGAVSNVAHIAAGLASGLGLGETDQAILMTRGLVESTRLGVALGADARTFSGLAGVGDLIPRPVTATRRHRRLGEDIGAGHAVHDALSSAGALEGVVTAREAWRVGEALELNLPLVHAVHDVLRSAVSPAAALERVLALDFDLHVAA